jgi:hypothetical protein
MVNIFGIKLFEGSSIEEQMHYKSRKGTKKYRHGYRHSHRHGPDCIDCKKKHKHSADCYNCSKTHHHKKSYKGGYVYNKKGANTRGCNNVISI